MLPIKGKSDVRPRRVVLEEGAMIASLSRPSLLRRYFTNEEGTSSRRIRKVRSSHAWVAPSFLNVRPRRLPNSVIAVVPHEAGAMDPGVSRSFRSYGTPGPSFTPSQSRTEKKVDKEGTTAGVSWPTSNSLLPFVVLHSIRELGWCGPHLVVPAYFFFVGPFRFGSDLEFPIDRAEL
ncbi:hypothetical protein BJY00DRAFT_284058 [Aspergillus carlsbadensis]|nr:hypothetical protein BJY00DRAFT_284058 [Aspergillus carlsbadensis]